MQNHKYIVANDLHLRSNNPIHRTDKYKDAIMNKVREICNLAIELDVDAVICGGDIFDASTISTVLLDDFMDMIEAGKDWLMIPGNHDEIGHNWANSAASSLAHACRRSSKIHLFEDIFEEKYAITGHRYYHGIESDFKENGLYIKEPREFNVAVTHAMITELPIMPHTMHVAIQDIKTNYDMVIIAHNHLQKVPHIVGDTSYIFSGAVGRKKINEFEIEPSVIYLDCIKKEVYPIILKCATDGREIFNLVAIQDQKEYNKEIDNFISNLSVSTVEGIDLRGIIEYICKENEESSDVINYLINKVGEYENE